MAFLATLASVNWAPIARTIASLDAIAFAVLGAWQLFTPTAGTAVGLSIYTICASVIIFLIELPLLCSCFKICVAVMKYTKYVAGYWFTRAVLYSLVVAGAYAIYLQTPNDKNWILLIAHVALTVAAAMYLLAQLRGERAPGVSGEDVKYEPAQAKAERAATGMGTFFGRAAVTAAAENPRATQSVAASMFAGSSGGLFGGGEGGGGGAGGARGGGGGGGGGGDDAESFRPSATAGVPKGFYDDPEEGGGGGGGGGGKEAMFSGNAGLFGSAPAPAAADSPPQGKPAGAATAKAKAYGVEQGSLGAPMIGGADAEDNPFAT